ncbi:MAG: class I SAM-dependent methyltransferase [Rhodococcus sp. (in: high G+C Gram-positive bacteria)]
MTADERDDTRDDSYTARLRELQGARWKQVLRVQAPYQWNIKRHLGGRRVLDVGCGIGRNLRNLPPGSVGVDHNASSVEFCRSQGMTAYTADEFHALEDTRFDGMLMAHLLEHLPPGEEGSVVTEYLPYLRPGATVMIVCPQEVGFASDPTHTSWLDSDDLLGICRTAGMENLTSSSFPFPRPVGKAFVYNETVVVGTTPG